MADEGIAPQDPVFVQKAKSAPAVDADGNPLAFEDQLDWCVRETESYYVSQLAAAAKIDAQDPVLQYYIDKTPRQDGSGNPVAIQARLKSAITQAQNYLATQRGEAVQEATAPLSVGARFAGGGSPPPAETVQPLSLKSAFDGARSHRTL